MMQAPRLTPFSNPRRHPHTMPARVFAAIKSYFKDAGAKPEILPVTGLPHKGFVGLPKLTFPPQALCSAPASELQPSLCGRSATRPTCRSTQPRRLTTRSSRASPSTTTTRRAACSDALGRSSWECLGASMRMNVRMQPRWWGVLCSAFAWSVC